MSTSTSTARFTLKRISGRAWIISDSQAADATEATVAHIVATDDDMVEVTWSEDLPLPVTYITPRDALENLQVWAQGPTGSTKPIPIAHQPPPST